MVASIHALEKERELLVLRGPELLWARQVCGGMGRGGENHKCRKMETKFDCVGKKHL
jgi:hypothetical protein